MLSIELTLLVWAFIVVRRSLHFYILHEETKRTRYSILRSRVKCSKELKFAKIPPSLNDYIVNYNGRESTFCTNVYEASESSILAVGFMSGAIGRSAYRSSVK